LLVNLPSPHPKASTHPSTPEMLGARERAPTLSPFVVVTFGLAIESIKEVGGASSKWLNQIQKNGIKRNVNKRKGFKYHCLDISYAKMWLVHIVTPTKNESCQIDIRKSGNTVRCNTFKHMWKCIIAYINIAKVM